MAVAAYAAVVSLIHVLDQIQQYPSNHRLHLDSKQIEALQDKVSFLQEFLELYYSQRISEEMEGLARQISNIANQAEDIVDSHVVNQIRKGFPDHSGALTTFCKNIERIMEKIDSIKGKLMVVKEGMAGQDQQPRVSVAAVSTAPPSISSGKNTMVGFDEHLVRIMDVLTPTGHKSDLQVLPIVGMGGIGKTTFARNVFDHPCMEHHFHARLWVTISQEYSTSEILRGLLQDMGVPGDGKNNKSGEDLGDLGEKLYKSLSGRRYLIIIDDVWSTKVWDDLHMFFPNNKNGSRIMVTTRLSNVAVSLDSNNSFLMDFLDENHSWNLFCKKAFAKDGCPPELIKIGKNIAKSCKGLPLAIVVIGGLLSKSNMTPEYWQFVAENVNSFANSGDDEHCLKILSLSYNHLPIHLKSCFLNMREFPEDDEIQVSKLIRLWVAQGFLKPIKDKTLEDAAQEYLEDLIGRNLLLICRLGINGKIKTCNMHDLLRDLCIRESYTEQFYCVPKVQHVDLDLVETTCFLCSGGEASTRVYLPRVVVSSQPSSLASCLVCDACRITYPQLNRLRLVKVLDVVVDILHPTKLRYLSIYGLDYKFVGNLIHLLWNLQTLIIECYDFGIHLPSEIWELPQLRHLKAIDYAILSDPPPNTQVERKDFSIILKNLRTLSSIENFRWSEDAIERIPNLKILGIRYYHEVQEWSYYSLHNLGRLHKLESLSFDAKALLTLKNINLPHSLKKLSLVGCNIPWEEMTIIGSLPNLEVLKLYYNAFEGPVWNPVEGDFLRLKLLLIESSNLKCWGVEKIHLPNIECLELRYMHYLEEIPSSIGEVETLRSIRLHYCKDSAVNSAKGILEEQQSFGNEDLQLHVDDEL